jgi:hypothetical protein
MTLYFNGKSREFEMTNAECRNDEGKAELTIDDFLENPKRRIME